MPVAATAAAVGAAIGGGVALVTGGDPFKGALLGAVGGGISGAIGGIAGGSVGGAVTSLLSGGDPIAGALQGGVTAGATDLAGGGNASTGSSGAVDTVGADAANSATKSLAQQAIDAPPAALPGAPAPTHFVGDLPVDASAGAPPAAPAQSPFVGDLATDPNAGAGGDASASSGSSGMPPAVKDPAAAPPGLIDRVLKAAKENQPVAAALLQVGGLGLAGAMKNAGDIKTAELKAALELENKKKLTQFYRDFIQQGSQGGAGTTLAVRSSAQSRPLQFMTGGNVYGGSGLIGSNL